MTKKDDWTNCNQCENEFKVISAHDNIAFCPFCGSELESILEEEFDDWNLDDLVDE